MELKIVQDSVLEEDFKYLYQKYAKNIADILAVREIPDVRIHIITDCPYPALTSGRDVFANKDWFFGKKDDGAMIHEFVHAIMVAPIYDKVNSWLIEGIADYVRDRLGFQTSWSKEHYEKGKALAGYQTSAHFLMYLETLQPTVIVDLSKALMRGAYSDKIFKKLFGKSLNELVKQYEKANEEQI